MAEPGVTVLVVDDHPIVRRGLTALLAVEPWVGRTVEAADLQEARAAAVVARPDVAVVDLGLPDGDGLTLVPHLRRTVPGCAVLVLTMTRDGMTVGNALAAGVNGFLLKDTPPPTILAAVRTVLDGGLVLGPDVPAQSLHGDQRDRLPPPFDRLMPAEIRMLALVARGARNAEIAAALGISDKTVRNRLSALLAAIGVGDRVQAALLARDAGLHLRTDS